MSRSDKCASCFAKISLLKFKCPCCTKDFCTKHRLPEDHKCEDIDKLRIEGRTRLQKQLHQEANCRKNKIVNTI